MRFLASFILGFLLANSASAHDFTLKSTDFANGSTAPKVFTCDGGNETPELHWQNPPAKTQSFALVGLGYDTPMGKIYGWTVYNIPATITGLPANIKTLPEGVVLGRNSLGDSSYRGPCPADSVLHHYGFVVYALDANLNLDSDMSPDDLMQALKHHILASAKLEAVYKH